MSLMTMLNTTPNSESSDYNPRKRMRKGTHSCLECRRRKIRCLFEPNADTCNRCIAKQLSCTEQEYGDAKALGVDKRKSMRERTSELEGMITQILTKLDSNAATTGIQDAETHAAEALRSLRTELLPLTSQGADVLAHTSTGLASPGSERSDTTNENSRHFQNPPLLSLFDNSVLSKGNEQHDGESTSTSHQPVADKHRRVLTALKSLMPSLDDIAVILRASRHSVRIWQEAIRSCTYETVDGSDPDEIKKAQDFIHRSLHSENISIVAQTCAGLALTMQQIPGTFDSSQLNLPVKPEALQDYYMTAVETLMASDDGLASSIEGLTSLIIQTKYHVNLGKPRKGWLTIRRALNFAQMLGFHRMSYHGKDKATATRKGIWLTIFQIERFLSLLLGYPSACVDAHYENLLSGAQNDGSLDPQRFFVRLSIITGQIINRNQDPNSMTVAVTLKIDQDLEDTRKILSSEWWNNMPGPETGDTDVFDTFVAKTFFHNVRMLLHLPFMLKSSTDRRYEYSRIAALESSREMVTSYHCLRNPVRPLVAVCNVIDFQVFTAAMLLTINLLGNADSSASDPEHDSGDWSIIQGLISDLQKVANGEESRGNNGVAAQALTVLEDLVKARFCTQPHAPNEMYQAVIPYFGKIRIRWGKSFRPTRKCSASSATTTPSLPSVSNPNQLPTPSDSSGTPLSFNSHDPQLSFDNYFQPLPGDMQPWQDQSIDWNALNDFELLNDWSWFANTQDQQMPNGPPLFPT
ncbi:MAG: hypothetical protein L6R39_004817 [Caloplaca ligustica]|nr:MAG: hypothetical protein L6R39_004817 [Caloplaca ligustica]